MAEEATVTVKESSWRRMRDRAQANEAEYRQAHREGAAMARRGDVGGGLMKISGANAPVIISGIAGAGLMWLMQQDWVSKIDLFRKHWWLRGLLLIIGGYALFMKGYRTWGAAIVGSGAAIMMADWKQSKQNEERSGTGASRTATRDASGPGDEDAGYWWEGEWIPERRWERRWEPAWEGRRLRERERWDEERAAARAAERIFRV
jgi:hypothetical protein